MASEQYRIPWAPLDISRGVADLMGGIQQRRENERADEYMRLAAEDRANTERRQSAEDHRRDENDKYQKAIAAFAARPGLERMAQKSVAAASDNPYNIKFEDGYDLPPNVEGPEMSPAAEAARFALGQPKAGAPPVAQPPMGTLAPAQEGPEQDPAASAARYMTEGPQQPEVPGGGNYVDAVSGGASQAVEPAPFRAAVAPTSATDLITETPDMPPSALAAASALGQPGPQGKHRIYEVGSAGQRFELPEQSDTTGLGPEYDALYQRMIENLPPGATPQHAFEKVLADYQKDQAEKARDNRLTQALGFRDKNREDQQKFTQGENEKYRSEGLTFEQRKELANIMARAKMASAGAGPVSPGVAELVGMKEQGATDEEIYARAAKLKLSQKDVATPVQNVVKNAAAGERAGQKREGLAATGEGTSPGDMWKNPQAATKGQQVIPRFHRVRERMQALIDHVEKYGDRIGLDSQEYKDRVSIAESAAAALRPYNELSSTDASMAAERAILGPMGAFGHGWTLGANLQGLKRILSEAEGQQKVTLETLLRRGGGSQLAPALGGPKRGAVGGDMVTIRNKKTGETKQVTREEAQQMGAL